MEWQPIETAPKDGTEIALFPAYWGLPIAIGRWAAEYNEGLWYMVGIGTLNGLWMPTHWMEFPKPPKETP